MPCEGFVHRRFWDGQQDPEQLPPVDGQASGGPEEVPGGNRRGRREGEQEDRETKST